MKIQNDQLTFFKKITGTDIADLAGMNKFKPKGDAVLFKLGYVKEEFDTFYTKRGELAEKLAFKSLTRRGFNCVTYDKFKCHFDNFPENPYFGGLIDIEIPSRNTLYEIKSKNIKDWDKISKYGDSVQEEQAMHYGYLRKYPEVHIMWIFFDDETETKIKNGEEITSYKNLKMFEKSLPIDYKKQKQIHDDALLYYVDCICKQSVPLADVSDKYLNILKLKRPQTDLQNGNCEQMSLDMLNKVVK